MGRLRHPVRFACILLLTATAFVTLPAARAQAQPVPYDHYKVYGVQPVISLPRPVVLRDQWGLTTHTVDLLEWFATPVQKTLPDGTGDPIFDKRTHYTWWGINPIPLQKSVAGENQFGSQSFVLIQSHYLLNPALKNEAGPLPGTNHYQCYDCLGANVDRQVTLTDQFASWTAVVTIPRFFCAPVEKQIPDTGEQYPIVDPNQHYVCYEIEPPDPGPYPAVIMDQFVDQTTVELAPGRFLCVPTQKIEPTPTRSSAWGRLKTMYR